MIEKITHMAYDYCPCDLQNFNEAFGGGEVLTDRDLLAIVESINHYSSLCAEGGVMLKTSQAERYTAFKKLSFDKAIINPGFFEIQEAPKAKKRMKLEDDGPSF